MLAYIQALRQRVEIDLDLYLYPHAASIVLSYFPVENDGHWELFPSIEHDPYTFNEHIPAIEYNSDSSSTGEHHDDDVSDPDE